ncbi:kinase-like protein [Melanomma pulvis-pyrius CBS 109.77]|uniref:Kinase-like protein n=1 Tax=Melanomma pulvis-pyrius CBS 109.77 TaxID=1314802 RepID=A0A6A6XA80_9PLEO|nr:kinase-like protein [Melanomma pulvis-pyrius CBS 109.77]
MSGVSNLVQDARLETYFHSQYLYHVYHDSDPLAGHRSVLRHEYWERRKHLGAGGFGSVWLEECVKGQHKGEMRAVKEIKRPQTLIDYNRELEALFKFSHARYARCFVKLLGWYDDEAKLYIAMDYFPLGNLESYLRNSRTPLPMVEVQQITFQLLEGVAFMHKNKFAHRDLKPANIVIQSQPPRTWWVKISDFGISKYSHDSQAASSNKGGTTAYMAPERQGYSARGIESSRTYPNAADMWALGEIAHTLLTKRHVFPTPYDLFQFTEKGVEFPCVHLRELSIDAVASSFILAVMVAAPENRLTAEEAQHHQWMTSLVPSSASLE